LNAHRPYTWKWVSLDNLIKAFGNVYSEKEILEMFELRDTNKDGKLFFGRIHPYFIASKDRN
jgi:hypothetical protein